MSRTLIICGLLLAAAGVLWPLLGKLRLGRLPGDIVIERPSYSFYFPIVTSLVLSVVLSILWLINRWRAIARLAIALEVVCTKTAPHSSKSGASCFVSPPAPSR